MGWRGWRCGKRGLGRAGAGAGGWGGGRGVCVCVGRYLGYASLCAGGGHFNGRALRSGACPARGCSLALPVLGGSGRWQLLLTKQTAIRGPPVCLRRPCPSRVLRRLAPVWPQKPRGAGGAGRSRCRLVSWVVPGQLHMSLPCRQSRSSPNQKPLVDLPIFVLELRAMSSFHGDLRRAFLHSVASDSACVRREAQPLHAQRAKTAVVVAKAVETI